MLIEAEVLFHVSPAMTVFPAVVGAVSVQAVPADASVWLQMVCDAETTEMTGLILKVPLVALVSPALDATNV